MRRWICSPLAGCEGMQWNACVSYQAECGAVEVLFNCCPENSQKAFLRRGKSTSRALLLEHNGMGGPKSGFSMPGNKSCRPCPPQRFTPATGVTNLTNKPVDVILGRFQSSTPPVHKPFSFYPPFTHPGSSARFSLAAQLILCFFHPFQMALIFPKKT